MPNRKMFGMNASIDTMPGADLLRLFEPADKQIVRKDEPHGKTSGFTWEPRSNETFQRQTLWIHQSLGFVNPANVRMRFGLAQQSARSVGPASTSKNQDRLFHCQRSDP